MGLQRAVQRHARVVGQRSRAGRVYRVGACSHGTGRKGQVVDDVQQVFLTALVGAAIALSTDMGCSLYVRNDRNDELKDRNCRNED